MNNPSKLVILGGVAVILAVLVTVVVAHEAGPMVAGAREQQPRLPTAFIIGDSTVKNSTEGLHGWGDPIAETGRRLLQIAVRPEGGDRSRASFRLVAG